MEMYWILNKVIVELDAEYVSGFQLCLLSN